MVTDLPTRNRQDVERDIQLTSNLISHSEAHYNRMLKDTTESKKTISKLEECLEKLAGTNLNEAREYIAEANVPGVDSKRDREELTSHIRNMIASMKDVNAVDFYSMKASRDKTNELSDKLRAFESELNNH